MNTMTSDDYEHEHEHEHEHDGDPCLAPFLAV